MKVIFLFILIGICTVLSPAQKNSPVADFERNISKYKLEKYAEGEDASSGFDYLYYKNKKEIVKVRVIWSSSANPDWTVKDYYYQNGKLTALLKYKLAKRQYRIAKLGKIFPFVELESFIISDNKLASWNENNKTVANTDSRWTEKEKEILESGKSYLEYYQELKAG